MNLNIIDKSLDNNDLLKNESLFHVANGYLGVRGNFEEGYKDDYKTVRGTYINGFYDISELKYSEKLYGFPETQQKIINLVDTQSVELYIDGDKFTLFEGEVIDYSRTLNMEEGYVERRITWVSPKGHELIIRIKRMASFVKLEMFTIEYEVTSTNYSGEIKWISKQNGSVSNYFDPNDPRVAAEADQNLIISNIEIFDDVTTIEGYTSKSQLKMLSLVKHIVSHEANIIHTNKTKLVETEISVNVELNQPTTLTKYCVYTDSRRHECVNEVGIQILNEVTTKSLDYWYKVQKDYLYTFWNNASVTIDGDELIQESINYNLYQLLQSVGKDRYSNITAKGLSGEGYEGHYFWDTEIYMFPFFLLTMPKLAKNLLTYRHSILDGARRHARKMGHKKGALYPWRTIIGDECSSYFPSGSAQYHINGDVAYSYIKYYLVTRDIDFIEEIGAEVLFETARLWCDAGHFYEGKFRIDSVTGPDEYTCIVNNNYYTNAVAKYNLKWAVNFYNILKDNNKLEVLTEKLGLLEEEVNEWEAAYLNMYLPHDADRDITPQDDTFLNKQMWDFENTPEDKYPLLLNYHPLYIYRHQVCKQADTVLAHFLLEDEEDISTIRNSYEYYEKITTHDSSLSVCIFSIMAAKLGYIDKAYNYFMETARLDLDNTHGNTKDGIHTANMGGTYMSIVYGFGGLRIKDSGLFFNPTIPEKWNEYTFKIGYNGREVFVKVNKSKTTFELLKGEGLVIYVAGKEYLLEDKIEI